MLRHGCFHVLSRAWLAPTGARASCGRITLLTAQGRHIFTSNAEGKPEPASTGTTSNGSSQQAGDSAAAAAGAADDDGEQQHATADSSQNEDTAELQAQLEKAREEVAAFRDRWQRSHAEMQNLIARQAREKKSMETYAVQRFAESLLEVADNLESAARAVPRDVLQPGAQVSTDVVTGYLRALLEGVTATERVLLKTMADKGVQRIETAEGDAFDPNTQEAMSMLPVVDADKAPGTVANVWQSGYRIHDRILRAAKVIVWAEAQ